MDIQKGLEAVSDRLGFEAVSLLLAAEMHRNVWSPVKGFLGGVAACASGAVESIGTALATIDDTVRTDYTDHQ